MLLEKTLESSLDSKEIQPVNHKGNQPWIFIGRTDTEVPIPGPPDAKSWLIRRDPDARKDWRQEEKGVIKNEMFGWHHWLNGLEFEQTLELVKDRKAWRAIVHEVAKSWKQLMDWTITPCCMKLSSEWEFYSMLLPRHREVLSEPWLVASLWLARELAGSWWELWTYPTFPDFPPGSLSLHLYVMLVLHCLNLASVAIFYAKNRKLIIVEINAPKAKETNERIRGMTQGKRLQLLHAALGKEEQGRVTIYRLYRAGKGGVWVPKPDNG